MKVGVPVALAVAPPVPAAVPAAVPTAVGKAAIVELELVSNVRYRCPDVGCEVIRHTQDLSVPKHQRPGRRREKRW